MIDCANCKYYQNGECHRHPPQAKVINLSSGNTLTVWPKVNDTFICGEGSLKDGAGPEEPANFTDNFQSDWFIINSPFDIIGFENFDDEWFVNNDFGLPIFTENYEGDWS